MFLRVYKIKTVLHWASKHRNCALSGNKTQKPCFIVRVCAFNIGQQSKKTCFFGQQNTETVLYSILGNQKTDRNWIDEELSTKMIVISTWIFELIKRNLYNGKIFSRSCCVIINLFPWIYCIYMIIHGNNIWHGIAFNQHDIKNKEPKAMICGKCFIQLFINNNGLIIKIMDHHGHGVRLHHKIMVSTF